MAFLPNKMTDCKDRSRTAEDRKRQIADKTENDVQLDKNEAGMLIFNLTLIDRPIFKKIKQANFLIYF